MAAALAPPVWKTIVIDSFGLVVAVWAIPVAILLIGTPIVMAASMLIAFTRWMLS